MRAYRTERKKAGQKKGQSQINRPGGMEEGGRNAGKKVAENGGTKGLQNVPPISYLICDFK